MNTTGLHLQIRIHESNGTVSGIDQGDPEIAKAILADLDPAQIFDQESLAFADQRSHSTFPVSQVTRIDFLSDSGPLPIARSGLVEGFELTKPQFEALVANPMMAAEWQKANSSDNSIVVFLELSLAGDQSVLLTLDMKFKSFPNFNEIHEHLFQRSGLCFRMQNGGVAIINLANLIRLTFFPDSHGNGRAWEFYPAERLGRPKPPISGHLSTTDDEDASLTVR